MARDVMDSLPSHPKSQPLSKIDELISQRTGYKGPWRGHPCTVPAVPSSSLTRLVWSLLWDLQQWKSHSSLGNAALHHPQLRKALSNIYSKSHWCRSSCPIDIPATEVCSAQSWFEWNRRQDCTITSKVQLLRLTQCQSVQELIQTEIYFAENSWVENYISPSQGMKMTPSGAHYEMPKRRIKLTAVVELVDSPLSRPRFKSLLSQTRQSRGMKGGL